MTAPRCPHPAASYVGGPGGRVLCGLCGARVRRRTGTSTRLRRIWRSVASPVRY